MLGDLVAVGHTYRIDRVTTFLYSRDIVSGLRCSCILIPKYDCLFEFFDIGQIAGEFLRDCMISITR